MFFYRAKGGTVNIGKTDMDYVVFGKGQKPFIIIPGLGDGLKTVKGTELLLARIYKCFAKEYKVYVFSRKNQLEEGYSTRDMARDQKIAMEQLGIEHAHVMGVSQGGMIAQYLAIDFPTVVDKLIIVASLAKQNDTVQTVVRNWITMAENRDYKNLIIDTMEKTFTENKLKKYRPFYPIISKLSKPKCFTRFLVQAQACLNHNAYDELHKIKSPTFLIGGNTDYIVGKNTSEEMAKEIINSQLLIYNGLGHGVYEEAHDFNQQVLEFLLS